VIELVGDGRRPLPVPDEELLAIQRIVDARLDAAPCAYFQGGERVRIEHGPLEGTEGTVVRHQNHHRVIVSIALLQRSVAVELDPAWISAAPVPWTRAASR
jgi:transcription antitermination factor NusG